MSDLSSNLMDLSDHYGQYVFNLADLANTVDEPDNATIAPPNYQQQHQYGAHRVVEIQQPNGIDGLPTTLEGNDSIWSYDGLNHYPSHQGFNPHQGYQTHSYTTPPQQPFTAVPPAETVDPNPRRSKRLRSGAPKRAPAPGPAPSPYTRSTTPDLPPPTSHFQTSIFDPEAMPGSFSSKLAAALPIPPDVSPNERQRRQAEMQQILTSNNPSRLPPPSPRLLATTLPIISSSVTTTNPAKLYRTRLPPTPVRIAPLLPQTPIEAYVKLSDDTPEGPERDAAVAHNNRVAEARRANGKRRNNLAAGRSRRKKERAIVRRSELVAALRAELGLWRARAVGLGAAPGEWEALDDRVRDELVADCRFDAWNFELDVPEDEREIEVEGEVDGKVEGAEGSPAQQRQPHANKKGKKVSARKTK